MDNHFHLLVETPEANLSQTGQWLNVSYSVWFNRRHQRSGHLFQGRFGAVLVGDDADWLEVGRYVHLNPVRSGEFCGGVAWKSIVEAVEAVHGGRWEEFRDRYGDWGRDAALYLGRQRGRLKLEELARLSGGVGYTAVAQAIRRVRQQIDRDKGWRRRIDAVSAELSKMKM